MIRGEPIVEGDRVRMAAVASGPSPLVTTFSHIVLVSGPMSRIYQSLTARGPPIGSLHVAVMPSCRSGGRTQAISPRKRPSETTRTHNIDDKCYVCGRLIAADAKVRLFHELMVHEACYLRHLRP